MPTVKFHTYLNKIQSLIQYVCKNGMGQILRFFLLFLMVFGAQAGTSAFARVNAASYGVVVNPGIQKLVVERAMDSLVQNHPILARKSMVVAIAPVREMDNKTADFYFLLFLCLLLGLIRVIDPKYFISLWRAFRNPTLSNRQLKDQLGGGFSSLLMNIFFAMTAGVYIYYLIKLFVPQRTGNIPPSLLIIMLTAGVMAIYAVKYLVIRFSGWAFKVEGITEHYIFSVFLINKIIGVVLLPFTLLIAFSDPEISGPAIIVSLSLIGLLLINRYTRSWQVFGSFFQYSKFHFFTYLCASEVLPLAVLMKLLVRGLIY